MLRAGLQVDILYLTVNQDWGFVAILPLLGTLPEEFTDCETIHPHVDHVRKVCVLPWARRVPLDSFFGIIATAPPPAWGHHGSPVPRGCGGSMDDRERRAGTTLYLPVCDEGSQFFAGNGEVCIIATEKGVTGKFQKVCFE